MRRSSLAVVLPLLLLFAGPAAAVERPDLFTAEIAVADESSDTRNAALRQLLADVLARVSGNAAIAGQPSARALLDSAPSLVQQYRYRTSEGADEPERYLWARFDQSAVERMMRDSNLPVWKQRPRVLLWLATDRNGRRALYGVDAEPATRASLTESARRHGMPLQLPLMDLEDQSALTTADLWSDYGPGIERASARYPHDVVLVGRLTDRGQGQWRGRWTLFDPAGDQRFDTGAASFEASLGQAIAQSQGLLAARYAPTPGAVAAAGTLVEITNVRDLAGYGRVVGFLGAQDPVAGTALRRVDGDRFVFELRLRGGEQSLLRGLQTGGVLDRAAPPLPSPPPAASASPAPPAAAAPPVDHRFRLRD